ncbi:MAG: hypothetical protein KDI22_06255 [Gammaproteobacteria bacterium]|nr:hypothetical protein [Gammaproteobacteria bacterium]MCP5317941.1 hypothetical protein [Chromatiaceae bacterium]MCB1818762.1 hypothetical protein [Gammaproteobacteria bacterium]MCP5430060.1 hypothetical protein [Chromatiaceae bacterium]MCP5435461.1 hypothetical protein [Chromatiaceae bacterium]
MDLSLIALLGGCLLLAAVLYYVIFVRREHPISPWGKSGLVTLMFVLVPVLVIALWYQAGAESRLAQIGFTPYPGFASSSGVATGLGENPVWVFSVEGGAKPVLEFYGRPENRKGWALVSESESLLLFEREGKSVAVSAVADSVAFTMRQGE